MLTLDKVLHAQQTLKEATYKTDVIRASKLSDKCELWLKAENLQKTGSFKIRGAYYKISQLSEEEKRRGVVACSAGNHAQGVALAASKNNIKSIICLPAGAPLSKIEATRAYGAELRLVDGVYDDAYRKAIELRDEHGYTFLHPFDDDDVIAGQGTIGLEIFEQIPAVDIVVVPVGGGGLISGVAFALKSICPQIKIYGVQAAGAPGMEQSLLHGKIESLSSVSTIADGIAVKKPGNLTYAYCQKYVDGVVTVTDDEISAAILALLEKEKVVSEGAGAAALASVLADKIPDIEGKKVCCLVSGGNIDVTILSRVIARGLIMQGRQCTLNIELLDKPGQLVEIAQIIAGCGANMTGVHHEYNSAGSEVIACFLRIDMETRNFEHIAEIKNKLTRAGFRIR